MTPKGKIRRALGVVKDQTRISIAKVASNLDPELDILIVKATSHDDVVPNEKFFEEILRRSSVSKELVSECVGLISKRVERTHDWIVALKCLILVHRVMSKGGEVFIEEIACNASNVKGFGMLSKMYVFKDEAHANSWDYTEFVRSYGMYLDERVEWMAFDQMRSKRRLRVSGGLDKELGLNKVSHETSTKRVLSRMEQLQTFLERVLCMRPMNVGKHKKLVVIALSPVIEESFKLYDDICEALSMLLDLYWGMEYCHIVRSLGTYVTVAKQIDELAEFYAWCKDFGVVTSWDYPVIERISDDLLSTMEIFMKKKADESKSAKMNKNTEKREPDGTSLKHETPESGGSTSLTIGLEAISENSVDEFQDLIDLNDDDDDVNFTSENRLENVSDNSAIAKVATESEINNDWELALIESASNLMNQKPEMRVVFDHLLLENPNCSQMIPLIPIPDGQLGLLETVHQNPFATSVGVPPHTYVQMAEMEKKQQACGEYGLNGMQQSDQISSAENNVLSTYYSYGFGPQAMIPYEMPGNSGQPGVQHHSYNPWSN